MPRRLALCLTCCLLLLGVAALAPGRATLPAADAAVSKSLAGGGGGGTAVSGAGDRLGRLLTGWAVPVLTVLAGCLLIGALLSRNIGAGVGILVITLLGLIFLLAPQSIESLAKGIAGTVF